MTNRKLDLLMNITGTSNTALALSLSLVPSHISRIRRGQRPIPKTPGFLHSAAEYFSRLPLDEHQTEGLAALLCIPALPADETARTELISRWLTLSTEETGSANEPNSEKPRRSTGEPAVYLGTQGRREAVIRFLSEIAAGTAPQTLLLYSGENMDWMCDPSFFPIWQKLCLAVLKAGNRMTMIHTTDRPPQEIMAGIQGWLPLYTTGLIDPYYCPEHSGKELYRRTLFIAPDTAAISAQSVHGSTEGMPTLYVTDTDAIAAFTTEYQELLAFCQPLMQMFPTGTGEMRSLMQEMENKPGEVFFYQPALKPSVFFHEKTASFTHILCFGAGEIDADGLACLKEIHARMKNDSAYRLRIVSAPQNVNTIYLKEKTGALVVNPLAETVSFFFNEPHLLKGMHDYLTALSHMGRAAECGEIEMMIQKAEGDVSR